MRSDAEPWGWLRSVGSGAENGPDVTLLPDGVGRANTTPGYAGASLANTSKTRSARFRAFASGVGYADAASANT
jgi:hypothetical protein